MGVDADIVEQSASALPEYGCIPISFAVRSVFDVELVDGGLGGVRLSERTVDPAWVKDYDASEDPTCWATHWDLSAWGVISALAGGVRVGGCVIAYDTPGVFRLEGRTDLAALWDIRVAPRHRRQGVGGRLVEAAATWARRRGCRMLKAETQNINVPACRFYAGHGFVLGSVNRYAYPDLPDEVEMTWCRPL